MAQLSKGPWRDLSVIFSSAASVNVLGADQNRELLFIHNPSSSSGFAFTILATATQNTFGNVQLAAGGTVLLDSAIATQAIQGIGTSGQGMTIWVFP